MENKENTNEELPVIQIEEPAEVVPVKQGRPSIFTPELARIICDRLSEGESVRRICKDEDMPTASTIHQWNLEDKEGFSKQYAYAREMQAQHMFDEILEISDNSDGIVAAGDDKKASAFSQNQRLKVDTRKWYLSKVLPKVYGDKVDVTSDGKAIKGNNILIGDFTDATNNK